MVVMLFEIVLQGLKMPSAYLSALLPCKSPEQSLLSPLSFKGFDDIVYSPFRQLVSNTERIDARFAPQDSSKNPPQFVTIASLSDGHLLHLQALLCVSLIMLSEC